jgi:hypothetical protein
MTLASGLLRRLRATRLGAAFMPLAVMLWLVPAAVAQSHSTVQHRLDCVLISGRLYLGNPGAGSNPKFVTCAIHFDQVKPHSDGVIVVLQDGHRKSTYSILRLHLPPQSSRLSIGWLHHRQPVSVGCALAAGRLYLGATGPARHKNVICSVRFYQLAPASDGVTVVLRHAHRQSTYSVVLRRLPHRPIGYRTIPWVS